MPRLLLQKRLLPKLRAKRPVKQRELCGHFLGYSANQGAEFRCSLPVARRGCDSAGLCGAYKARIGAEQIAVMLPVVDQRHGKQVAIPQHNGKKKDPTVMGEPFAFGDIFGSAKVWRHRGQQAAPEGHGKTVENGPWIKASGRAKPVFNDALGELTDHSALGVNQTRRMSYQQSRTVAKSISARRDFARIPNIVLVAEGHKIAFRVQGALQEIVREAQRRIVS